MLYIDAVYVYILLWNAIANTAQAATLSSVWNQ